MYGGLTRNNYASICERDAIYYPIFSIVRKNMSPFTEIHNPAFAGIRINFW